ncbi:peptide-methionine (R)-S-oxide reductase MsrB [Flavobacteriaceae bacterium]|nr:peptide-methionine (R)-S-oxide reductase MsrB [Flavobacteriaceae bacterium]
MSKYPVHKTDAEWKAELSPEEYHILRKAGTERPFSGKFNNHQAQGTYVCKGCGEALYEATSKFDSGCGWPSYDKSIEGAIEYRKDSSLGMLRVEILCANCGGHQGHVFEDGPTATGQRYCVNSASIDFKPGED